MSEEDGVEVCHVCQEIFLEEAALKSHMKELHPDDEQCESEEEVRRAGRHSTVVAVLEKQKEISSHDGLDQALAGECARIKEGREEVGML